MDDFFEKKPKKHSDAALATAARFSWATDLNQELDCQGIQLYITKSVHSQALPMFASKLVGLLQISSKLTDIEYFEANHANSVICLL